MKKIIYLLAFLPLANFAQTTDVIFLNEGYFNTATSEQEQFPSLGVYSSETEDYLTAYTFDGSGFVSDAVIHEGHIYIAADEQIVKLSADDYSYIDAIEMDGVRDLAVYNNLLIASRGEFLQSFDSYLHMYDLSDLSLVEAFPNDGFNGPSFATEDIKILGDRAFICVSNSFDFGNIQSLIGIYDFTNESYAEVDLGPDGLNPENLMIHQDQLYAFCNHQYDKSSVAKLDPTTLNVDIAYVANNAGCALSAVIDNKIYYQEYALDRIARFDLESFSVLDTLDNQAFYSIAQNPENGEIWASSTDYFSSGMAHRINTEGNELEFFEIGISCGNILFNQRSSVSVDEAKISELLVYPNPSNGLLNIEISEYPSQLEVYALNGSIIHTEQLLNPRTELSLAAGVYILRLMDDKGLRMSRVIVE